MRLSNFGILRGQHDRGRQGCFQHRWADVSRTLRKIFFVQHLHFSTCVKFLALTQVSGVIAVMLFRENDPVHFRSLHVAMLSLFRMATLEDWTDIMYVAMHGCAKTNYQYSASTYGIHNIHICKHSGDGGSTGGIAVVFFVFFIVSACCLAACVAGLVLSGRWLSIADDRRLYLYFIVCWCHH